MNTANKEMHSSSQIVLNSIASNSCLPVPLSFLRSFEAISTSFHSWKSRVRKSEKFWRARSSKQKSGRLARVRDLGHLALDNLSDKDQIVQNCFFVHFVHSIAVFLTCTSVKYTFCNSSILGSGLWRETTTRIIASIPSFSRSYQTGHKKRLNHRKKVRCSI